MKIEEVLARRSIETAMAYYGKNRTGKQFHMTFIYQGKRLIALGINDYTKKHPSKRFGHYRPTKGNSPEYQPSLHSEIDALIKLGENNARRYTFFNVRISPGQNIRLSKPCENCMGVMKQIGFKRFYYTDNDGQVRELNEF